MKIIGTPVQKYERERASKEVMDLFRDCRKDKEPPTLKDLVQLAKRLKYPETSHFWGGNFPFFSEVGEAADEIGKFCRRWGRINVTQTKEKYGEARVYLNFGWYQLFSITHPGYCYSRYPKWLWTFDIFYISKVIRPLNRIVVPYQTFIYRLAYKRVIKKYPLIREEILGAADYSELLEGL